MCYLRAGYASLYGRFIMMITMSEGRSSTRPSLNYEPLLHRMYIVHLYMIVHVVCIATCPLPFAVLRLRMVPRLRSTPFVWTPRIGRPHVLNCVLLILYVFIVINYRIRITYYCNNHVEVCVYCVGYLTRL